MESAFLQLKEFLFVNLNTLLLNIFKRISTQGCLQMKNPTTELMPGSPKTSLSPFDKTDASYPWLKIVTIMFLNSQGLESLKFSGQR